MVLWYNAFLKSLITYTNDFIKAARFMAFVLHIILTIYERPNITSASDPKKNSVSGTSKGPGKNWRRARSFKFLRLITATTKINNPPPPQAIMRPRESREENGGGREDGASDKKLCLQDEWMRRFPEGNRSNRVIGFRVNNEGQREEKKWENWWWCQS